MTTTTERRVITPNPFTETNTDYNPKTKTAYQSNTSKSIYFLSAQFILLSSDTLLKIKPFDEFMKTT